MCIHVHKERKTTKVDLRIQDVKKQVGKLLKGEPSKWILCSICGDY